MSWLGRNSSGVKECVQYQKESIQCNKANYANLFGAQGFTVTVLDGEAVCVLKGERDRGGRSVTGSGTGATGQGATEPGQQAADIRQDGRHSHNGPAHSPRQQRWQPIGLKKWRFKAVAKQGDKTGGLNPTPKRHTRGSEYLQVW